MPITRIQSGSADLPILRILFSGETMDRYGIADRIQDLSARVQQLAEGSLSPALHRMDKMGWIRSEWAASEHNRRGQHYRITVAGRRQLAREEATWLLPIGSDCAVLRLA